MINGVSEQIGKEKEKRKRKKKEKEKTENEKKENGKGKKLEKEEEKQGCAYLLFQDANLLFSECEFIISSMHIYFEANLHGNAINMIFEFYNA